MGMNPKHQAALDAINAMAASTTPPSGSMSLHYAELMNLKNAGLMSSRDMWKRDNAPSGWLNDYSTKAVGGEGLGLAGRGTNFNPEKTFAYHAAKGYGYIRGGGGQHATKLFGAYSMTPVINPIRTNVSWNFAQAGSVLDKLKAARPDLAGPNVPGFTAIQDIVSGLVRKGYDPKLYLGGTNAGGGNVFPYLQMKLTGNGQIIDLPFEMQSGHAFSGLKHRAVRGYTAADKTYRSFSQEMVKRLGELPAAQEPELMAKAIGQNIYDLMGDLASPGMHGGGRIESRSFFHGAQTRFSAHHEYSKRLRDVMHDIGRVNTMKIKGDAVAEAFGEAQRSLTSLFKDMGKEGFSVMTTKWDQVEAKEYGTAKMVATRSDFTVYQGIMAGNPAKGFGQLAQRSLIPHKAIKSAGFTRSTPWLQPTGYGSNVFEMPINVGVMHPKYAARYLGDSGAGVGNDRFMQAMTKFPVLKHRTVHARALEGGTQVERAFSPVIEGLFKKYRIDEYFDKTGRQDFMFNKTKWLTEDPMGLSRNRARNLKGTVLEPEQIFLEGKWQQGEIGDYGGTGVKRFLGQNLGRTATDRQAGVGNFVTMPEGMGLTGVTRRRVKHGFEYDFLFKARGDVADFSNTTFLMGSKRLSPQATYNLGGGKLDVIMGAQDYWGKSFASNKVEAGFVDELGQAGLAGRWLEKTKDLKAGGGQRSVAKILGLTKGKIANGQMSYVAGNDWLLTDKKVDTLRGFFKEHMPEMARDDNFFATKIQLDQREIDAFIKRKGITSEAQIREINKLNMAKEFMHVMEGSPIAFRNAMAGLKSHRGMTYRLDQMMNMMARAGSDPTARAAYMGQAEAMGEMMRRAMKSTGKTTFMQEAGTLFGPMIKGGAQPFAGAEVKTLADYRKFIALPNTSGGIGPEALKGTILEPGRPGFWLDYGAEVGKSPYYYGTEAELVTGGNRRVTTATKSWIPSSNFAGIGLDDKGIIYNKTKVGSKALTTQGALANLDTLLQGDERLITPATLGRQISSVHAAGRAAAFAKEGIATPGAKAFDSAYSRLQLLGGPGDSTRIGLTRGGLEKRFGEQAGRIEQMIRSQEGFYADVLRYPQKEAANYMTGIRVRMVEAEELADLGARATKGSWDEVLFAGRGIVGHQRADFDADAIVTHFNLDKGAQKRARQIAEKQSGFLELLSKTAKDWEAETVEGKSVFRKFRSTTEAAGRVGGWANTVAEGTAELWQAKYTSPFPEVFMRARHNVAKLIAMNTAGNTAYKNTAGILTTPLAELQRYGFRDLSTERITQKGLAAMQSFAGTFSQTATNKAGQMIDLSLSEALYKSRGQNEEVIKEALRKIVAGVKDSGKFPHIAMGFESQGAMINEAARSLNIVERGFAAKEFVETPFGAVYGPHSDKRMEAVAKALGGEVADVEGFADPAWTKGLANDRGVSQAAGETQEAINTAEKAAARAGGPGHISRRLNMKNAIGFLRSTWGSGWKGKAALIAAGALAIKTVADAVTPVNAVSNNESPMPPDIRMSNPPPAPQFAIPMPDTRVEHPRAQAFMAEGQVEGAYFSPDRLVDHLSTNVLGSTLAYGKLSMQNQPMTESDMEYYLRDKMRSDF